MAKGGIFFSGGFLLSCLLGAPRQQAREGLT